MEDEERKVDLSHRTIQDEQARLRKKRQKAENVFAVFKKPLHESLTSVLPVMLIVLVLCFTIAPVPNNAMVAFLLGGVMLIAGMGLFTLGSEMSMIPLGQAVGSEITRRKKVWIITVVGFLIGMIITVAEPDLQVLANQVPAIENNVIIWSVAVGVGVFLVIALLRIVLGIQLRWLLIGFYAIVFTLAMFVSPDFWAVAFDSGGVTTGPMTVPFIMALGVGVCAVRSDKQAGGDSFGLVALCSIGPIITVLILGLLYKPDGSAYTAAVMPDAKDTVEMFDLYLSEIPHYLKETASALLPIGAFLILFQLVTRRLKRKEILHMVIGLVYVYIGLTIFLMGVNVGFMPVGSFLGGSIASHTYNWILIPIAMVIGYFIVQAEPAEQAGGGDHRRFHPGSRHEPGAVCGRGHLAGAGYDPGADGYLHHVVPGAGLCAESGAELRGAADLYVRGLRLRRRGLRTHDGYVPAALRPGRLRRCGRQSGDGRFRCGGDGGHDAAGDHTAAGPELSEKAAPHTCSCRACGGGGAYRAVLRRWRYV